MNNFILTLTVHVCVYFQKSPLSDLINMVWDRDFSYLIGISFSVPKSGHCTKTNQSSSLGPMGIKLSLTSN